MKTNRWRIAGALMMTLALFAGPGCETDDHVDSGQIDDYFEANPYVSGERPEGFHYLRITPASASVTYVGEVVRFQVDGGTKPYSWEVANSRAGAIAPTRVNEALYTVRNLENNDVMVFDRGGRSGVAKITVPGAPPGTPLTASASPNILGHDGDRCLLTARGGTPPYRWTLQDAALGSLDTDVGATVIYTRNRPGDNSARVTDAAGNTAAVVIQQP